MGNIVKSHAWKKNAKGCQSFDAHTRPNDIYASYSNVCAHVVPGHRAVYTKSNTTFKLLQCPHKCESRRKFRVLVVVVVNTALNFMSVVRNRMSSFPARIPTNVKLFSFVYVCAYLVPAAAATTTFLCLYFTVSSSRRLAFTKNMTARAFQTSNDIIRALYYTILYCLYSIVRRYVGTY